MVNNELFHRAACEGLSDSTTIAELVDDLNEAIESYFQDVEERGGLSLSYVGEEIELGYRRLEALADNLRQWQQQHMLAVAGPTR